MKLKLTLFGLAFLLVFSALVVVLPEPVLAATTYTWDAPADGVASLDTNWNPVGVPGGGDAIIFDSTSTFKCTWNLTITTGNFSLLTGCGQVTIAADMGMSSFYQIGGVFTGSLSYVVTCSGDFQSGGTGSVSANLLRLKMTGDDSTLTAIGVGYVLRGLQISANVHLQQTSPDFYVYFPQTLSSYLTIDAGKTITLNPSSRFYIYLHDDFVFTNLGTIDGPTAVGGDIWFRTWLTSPTIAFGAITASVHISSAPADSQTLYLGADTLFTSNLTVFSTGITGTNYITLHHGSNYTLTVTGKVSQGNRANFSQGRGSWSFGSLIETGTLGSFSQDDGELTLGGNFTRRSTAIPNLVIAGNTHLDVGSELVSINLPSYYDVEGLSNFSGPANRMVEASNGDYLAFIREGESHVETGDYAVMNLYRSLDNGTTFAFESEIKNIGTRDVRNYACGMSETGRVFVFYTVYDVDNETWEDMVQYMYSDDNGTTWSSGISMDIPIIDGMTFALGTPFGNMIITGGGRLGLSYYGNNSTHSQVRFLYSDDDGLTWNQNAITTSYPMWQHHVTETEVFYLGNDAIVALSRVNGRVLTSVHTSTDNGLTWDARGNITKPIGAYPPSMTSVLDPYGRPFILTIYAYQTIYYSIAKVSDVLLKGPDAWSTCIQMSETTIEGMYASMIFNGTTGNAVMLINNQDDLHNSTTRIVNMTVSISSASMIVGNITVNAGSTITFDDDGYIIDYGVVGHIINSGVMTQNDMTVNVTGNNETPLTGFGTFDGHIYLNGSVASNYIAQVGLPMGNLHTDRDTMIYFATARYMRVIPSSTAFLNVSISSYDGSESTIIAWTLGKDQSISSVAYSFYGLPSYGYQVLHNGSVIATGIGPSFSFTANGDGEFEIVVWNTKAVSSLIVLTVNMVGLGIIVAVLGSYIAPIARDIQEKRPIKPEKLTQNLIRTVIFIVVATLMWGVLHSIAIG